MNEQLFASPEREAEFRWRFGAMTRQQRARFARIATDYRALKQELADQRAVEERTLIGSSLNPVLLREMGCGVPDDE